MFKKAVITPLKLLQKVRKSASVKNFAVWIFTSGSVRREK